MSDQRRLHPTQHHTTGHLIIHLILKLQQEEQQQHGRGAEDIFSGDRCKSGQHTTSPKRNYTVGDVSQPRKSGKRLLHVSKLLIIDLCFPI